MSQLASDRGADLHFNRLTANLFNLNFHPLEVVSRWRDSRPLLGQIFYIKTHQQRYFVLKGGLRLHLHCRLVQVTGVNHATHQSSPRGPFGLLGPIHL